MKSLMIFLFLVATSIFGSVAQDEGTTTDDESTTAGDETITAEDETTTADDEVTTSDDETTTVESDDSNVKFIPAPTLVGGCEPGLCSNGSDSGLTAEDTEVIVDHLTPCQLKAVVRSKYVGNISLDSSLYCNPRTLRSIPGVTCCSPQKPTSKFPRLYLFPVFSDPFTTKPTRLDWRKKRHASKLPKSGDIIVLIHGWREQPLKTGSLWIYPAIEAWTRVRRKPVIVVDYDEGSYQYFQAAANARTIGAAVGYALVNWDITDRTILVGFSMGGQVVGEVGKYTTQQDKPIKECVGIDPAGPGFDSGSPEMTLSPNDCTLVQVIHSSSEVSPTSLGPLIDQYGVFAHSGACDFWINCGRTQGLDCLNPTYGAMMDDVPEERKNDSIAEKCAHYRGSVVYAASVANKCIFIGKECTDCADFRFTEGCHILLNGTTMKLPPYNECQPGDRKDFYVQTATNEYPYCLSP